MNKSNQEFVQEFMDACGQTERFLNSKEISEEDLKIIKLRLKLITEELSELYEAIFSKDVYRVGFSPVFSMLFQILSIITKDDLDLKLVDVLDALTDMDYINCGTGVYFNLPLKEAFKMVHENNMTKVDKTTGKVLKNSDGKILKPEGFVPVDLTPLIQKL